MWTKLMRLSFLLSTLLLLAPPSAAEAPPAPPARAAAPRDQQALDRELAALTRWVTDNGGRLSGAFVDVERASVIAESSGTLSLNPASTTKIYTAAAALSRLGPAYRYTTSVHGRIDERGVADSLVLRGHGDPSLSSRDLAELARTLGARGLVRLEGDLLVDQSRFDASFVPPAFDQQPNEWAAFRSPVSAIAVDRNAIRVIVEPTRSGQPARVRVEPAGFVEIAGSVTTAPAGRGDRVRVVSKPLAGKLRVEVGGELAEGAPRVIRRRRVDDPTLLPGYVLAHFLAREGVTLTGSVRAGGANVRSELASHVSAPLSALVGELGKQSDNFYAEMLMKTLGAEAGAPGTSAAGAAEITAFLRDAGAFDASVKIVNGSGLFDANRSSALALAKLLAAGFRDPAISAELVAQLAIGGVDGTLRSRFRAQRASRAVRAKTGTLARVIALAGYVMVRDRPPIAFAIIVNGIAQKQHAELRQRIDQVVARALP